MKKQFVNRVVVLGIIFCLAGVTVAAGVSVIPMPDKVDVGSGEFRLNSDTKIVADSSLKSSAVLLRDMLSPATGYSFRIVAGAAGNAIELVCDRNSRDLGKEGYRLNVATGRIVITACGKAGLFYGMQTLRQLLPAEIYEAKKVRSVRWSVPCVSIEDSPRFGWRGAMLDPARYFIPKEYVLKFIDLLALHKMNSLHLHLTDDQGWRIEIKKYPLLTEVGAWRKHSIVGHYNSRPRKYDGKRHGGFYTQDDIRETVAYAAQRNINVVPEIEMPGHGQAAIAAYPYLGCLDTKLDVSVEWGVHSNIYNPFDKTISFLQDVLLEVMELFPSKFIHIGGDEATKTQWKKSAEIQQRIKDLGLKDEHEMQSWFIKQMDTFLTSHGRRLIGWDEILEGGLAPNATVMSWRGEAGGITAARAGHDVVMAPTTYTYLDYYQSRDKGEPLAIGGFLPLAKVYGYDPISNQLSADQAKYILGVQGQLWNEYIPTTDKLEYMAFPRLIAIAEVGWTDPEKKDYEKFVGRLEVHQKRFDAMEVNYRELTPEPTRIGEWKSGQVGETYQAIDIDISKVVTKPGQYEIMFRYTGGTHRLDIEWVKIVADGKVVGEDEHFGTTGGRNEGNTYSVKVDKAKAGSSYVVRANVRADGGDDSNGIIYINPPK